MLNIAELTMKQTQNHLALAQGAAHLTKRLIVSEVVGSEQSRLEALEKYFLDQLAIYPHFAGIYIGSPNGDFFYVNRSDLRVEGGYRTKIITRRDGQRQTLLMYRDRQHQLLGQENDPRDTYDPRERPWYQKVLQEKAISWSDPYIFYTSQKPGITIAGPIYREQKGLNAIVGVDIEIDQLSDFIGALRIGKHGRAFMLNNNGDVVAFPDIEKIMLSDERDQGKIRMVRIEELDDGLSRAAYNAMEWPKLPNGRIHMPKAQFAKFEYQDQAYHAMFTPFNDEQWPWIIGVYVPEGDYLGSINANRRLNLWITLGLSLLATLIGLKLAGGIIKPLAQLEKEALAIKKHDLSTPVVTQSIYKEIQETADQFACMKIAIRDFEDKYRGIFDNIQDIYYEASLEGRFLEVSPSVERIFSYRREELIGQPLQIICAKPQEIKRFMSTILSSQKVTDFEISVRDKDQREECCSINASLKSGAENQSDRIIGSLRVITHRKKAEIQLQLYRDHLEELVQHRTCELENANTQLRGEIDIRKDKEQALKKSEEKYRSIIDNMPSGYYEMDLDGNLTFFNDPLVHILGYPADHM
jgi:PAS domain S-box-containing protein